ncbi:MAG: hypothetical protein ACK559_10660, partial [bacterium]
MVLPRPSACRPKPGSGLRFLLGGVASDRRLFGDLGGRLGGRLCRFLVAVLQSLLEGGHAFG